jgi:hypothetical protein
MDPERSASCVRLCSCVRPANMSQKSEFMHNNHARASVFVPSMSEESIKAELWEARVDAVTGTRFFVNRLTKAVRHSSPSQLVPEVLASPRIRFAGAVDAFRKELILIMSSPALSSEAKEKQCRCVLTDTWRLLCSEASGDRTADPIFYVSTLMDVYDAASVAASAMLDSGTITASCLSFLVDSKQGALLFLCTFHRKQSHHLPTPLLSLTHQIPCSRRQ